MRKLVVTTVSVVLLFSAGFAIHVVTTIHPYYLIVSEISEGRAEVSLLVEPGINPHTFSPKVSQIKVIAKADIIIANGLGLEPYLRPYSKKTLYVGEKIPKFFLNVENHEAIEGVNPHVWLDPLFVKYYIVPTIVEALNQLDPENRDYYLENAKRLIKKLDAIIRRAYALLTPFAGTYVIVTHPSFYYFFREYSIRVLSVEEGHGVRPSIAHLEELIKLTKSGRVLGLFHEPQMDDRGIKTIAKETKRTYTTIDPLGVEAKSIEELFDEVLDAIEGIIHE
ncbi:MAG: zinc ABC transporter substrate-binding protein [Thermotogae bacterium]|nr:MAG: zinc ABC transporter substrate-binding protein [Thermotogota bacterium]